VVIEQNSLSYIAIGNISPSYRRLHVLISSLVSYCSLDKEMWWICTFAAKFIHNGCIQVAVARIGLAVS